MENKLLGRIHKQRLAINTIEECKDVIQYVEDVKLMNDGLFPSYTFNQKVLSHIETYLENWIATLSNKNLEDLIYYYNDGNGITISYKHSGVGYKNISLDSFKDQEGSK